MSDFHKDLFKNWLKDKQNFFEENPVISIPEWLHFAQDLQRHISETFRVTACQVTLRYTNIFDGKAVDIEVWRKDNPNALEYSFFYCVTLHSEFNKFPIEIQSQRTLLNKFIDSLIVEL